jgi:hypothetical protein
MQVEAVVAQQPSLHGRRLMGRKIVQDDVNVEQSRDLAVDLV